MTHPDDEDRFVLPCAGMDPDCYIVERGGVDVEVHAPECGFGEGKD